MFNSSNCYSLSDIAAVSGNNRNNGGFGDNGWEFIWILLIFCIFGGWGNGFGGWGGNGGGSNSPGFQGWATRADIDAALSTQGIENGIQNVSTQLCNGFANVNSNLSNLGYQIQDCCCQTQRAVDGVNYNMAMQTNALQNTMNQNANALQSQLCNGFRDVIDAQNAGTQRIVDMITQDKIQSLQTDLQSAQLQLSNANQTTNIVNALRPTPVPAYPVLSPYTSIVSPTGITFGNGCGYGCGCNTGCGC